MVLEAPIKHHKIPKNASWLGGEGAGSWFQVSSCKSAFRITRFSPDGKVECSGLFETSIPLCLKVSYKISYPSHCSVVTILQGGQKIILRRKPD